MLPEPEGVAEVTDRELLFNFSFLIFDFSIFFFPEKVKRAKKPKEARKEKTCLPAPSPLPALDDHGIHPGA